MERTERPEVGPNKVFAIVLTGVMTGFILGLGLAVLAGSFVWLDMRVNVGLLIPAAAFLCPVFAYWKRKTFSYTLFLAGQGLLFVVLIAVYGFDAGALWSVPASLLRDGFYSAGLPLETARSIVGAILLGGNLLWIVFLVAVKLGYKNVYRQPGGIKAWTDADYPIEKVK
jgi:hypothetical protein